MTQLDLIPTHPNEHLFCYWHARLAAWPREVFEFRHRTNCTGWSLGGYHFARLLYNNGQITLAQVLRYYNFRERLLRWEEYKTMKTDQRVECTDHDHEDDPRHHWSEPDGEYRTCKHCGLYRAEDWAIERDHFVERERD